MTFVQRRRGADVVQMLYKCFVFAGLQPYVCHVHTVFIRPSIFGFI